LENNEEAFVRKDILIVIITYFAVASTILTSAYVAQTTIKSSIVPIPETLSLLLLIPIYVWYRCSAKKTSSGKNIGKDKSKALFWVFILFTLALSVRIPSALLFNMPYEKTPLIYLIVLTIILVEKTNVSVFGFTTVNFCRSVLHGLVFYAVSGGLILITYNCLLSTFISQASIEGYDVASFLSAMPFMILCVGISEEGFFRGYVQTSLEKFYTPKKAILTQAILFGGWHFIWNLSPFKPLEMSQYILTTFFTGLLFGYFYQRTRNLVPLVVAHGLWNSVPEGIVINNQADLAVRIMPYSSQALAAILSYSIPLALTFLLFRRCAKKIQLPKP